MGRGFFYTDEPLRDLDPEGVEAVWPGDRGEPHVTGMIFGGAMWDLMADVRFAFLPVAIGGLPLLLLAPTIRFARADKA